jgi:hypothetical protein
MGAKGNPISYLLLAAGVPVESSDGVQFGTVERVLAVPDEDIFDGLILATPNGRRFVDSENVDEIYDHAVVLKLSADDTRHLPEPSPSPAALEVDPDTAAGRHTLHDTIRAVWDRVSGNY